MAVLHYSMSGEGRGHAARARVIVEMLRTQHKVILYASGQALEMLRPAYAGSDVVVEEIPGLRFSYDGQGRLKRARSLGGVIPFLFRMPERVRSLTKKLEGHGADLVISDFEPLLPRAAATVGVPSMCLDHQQFLLTYDLGSLPLNLRLRASFIAQFMRPFYYRPRRSVVSAFFFPSLSRSRAPVVQAGVLLRESIARAVPEPGGHLVAYVRREAPAHVLEALSDSRYRVHVYGLGRAESRGRLRFFDIDAGRFSEDLATSRALVTTAGNQVVGEALYLGKPILAYPEPGNLEQHINAYFLQECGAGWARGAEHFSGSLVRSFLDALPLLGLRVPRSRLNGNPTALSAIEEELSAGSASTIRPAPGAWLSMNEPREAAPSMKLGS